MRDFHNHKTINSNESTELNLLWRMTSFRHRVKERSTIIFFSVRKIISSSLKQKKSRVEINNNKYIKVQQF